MFLNYIFKVSSNVLEFYILARVPFNGLDISLHVSECSRNLF